MKNYFAFYPGNSTGYRISAARICNSLIFRIMNKNIIDIVNRAINFWTVNLFGWGLYSLINFPTFVVSQRLSFKYFLAAQTSSLTGFIITVYFRSYFRRYNILEKSYPLVSLHVIILSLVFGIFWYVADSFTSWFIHGREDIFKEKSFYLILYYVLWGGFVLAAWCVLYIAVKLWRKYEAERLKLEEAKKLTVKAQLNALRYQLNPHFLFNSLSTLRGILSENPVLAKQMIGKLSSFLQYSLTGSENISVPLSMEIENVKAYLDVEKIRFGDALDVKYKIDPLAEDYPVPSFLLNPLIENAVKYGYDTCEGVLKIIVSAEVRGDKSLALFIENSGRWVENNNSDSLGLSNVKKRLELAYNEYKFEILKTADSVIVHLAFRSEL